MYASLYSEKKIFISIFSEVLPTIFVIFVFIFKNVLFLCNMHDYFCAPAYWLRPLSGHALRRVAYFQNCTSFVHTNFKNKCMRIIFYSAHKRPIWNAFKYIDITVLYVALFDKNTRRFPKNFVKKYF